MSDLLTHWAVFEDLRRISQHDPLVDPQLAAIMQDEREFARLAPALQHGQPPTPAELEAALAENANRSGYGRTLELGMNALRKTSAYWRGETSAMPDLKQNYRYIPTKG